MGIHKTNKNCTKNGDRSPEFKIANKKDKAESLSLTV